MDPVTMIMLALQAVNAAQGTPDAPNTGATATPGTQAPNPLSAGAFGQLPVPETGAVPINGVDMTGLDDAVTQIATAAAKAGEAPATVPSKGPGRPEFERQQAEAEGTSIGEVLAATPQAISSVANLLGLNQPNARDIGASAPGGTAGNLVQGFNLPQVPAIGQILAGIPRLR